VRSDALTKLLLALIATGVLVSVAVDLRWMGPSRSHEELAVGRYRIMLIGMGRQLVMLDTQTGKTWRSPLRSIEWEPIGAPGEASGEPPDDAGGEDPAEPEASSP